MTTLSNHDRLLLRRHLLRAQLHYMMEAGLLKSNGKDDSVNREMIRRYESADAQCQDFINRLTKLDTKEDGDGEK